MQHSCIEIIREKYNLEVSFVTRTVPVLNDAVLGDALSVGIDTIADVIENGIHEPLPGTILGKTSSDVRALVEESDSRKPAVTPPIVIF